MAIINHVSDTILQHKLQDIEETFNHGQRLYRFELFLGGAGIGLTTLACLAVVVWITSKGAPRELGLVAAAALGASGLLAVLWLRARVRRWTRDLLMQTNEDRAVAYRAYISEQDKL